MNKTRLLQLLFLSAAIFCFFPQCHSPLALFLGLAWSLVAKEEGGKIFSTYRKGLASKLLMVSVVGLGASMNLQTVLVAGQSGLTYTALGLLFTMALGFLITTTLKVKKQTGILLSVGTAICGGSAIAAAAPVLGAEEEDIAVSMGIIFILNSIALLIFPLLGRYFKMPEHAFGLWCALSIHDTSSVVGATLGYGPLALQTGTTVKLARALWIMPLTFILMLLNKKTSGIKIPWFIFGFLVVSGVCSYTPGAQSYAYIISWGAKHLLMLTLFLIGAGLNLNILKKVGWRPFFMGISLWIVVGVSTYLLISRGVIN